MTPEVQKHREIVQRIIGLANQIKDEGAPVPMVSDALMVASGFYATYAAVGNEGGLTDSGIEKVAARYKQRLQVVQGAKRDRGEGDSQKRREE